MTNTIAGRRAATSLIAMTIGLLSTAAHAQASTPAATPAEPAAAQSSPDEIVVTGLKRDVKLVNVPASVAVYDSIKIQNAGIKTPTDFLSQTSNVNITTSVNPGDFLINMRGQSSVRGAEPSVAILIDGAKVGSPAEFNTSLFDLEQIEVLKGPQGAYYGRNASAGAIILTTKKPTEEFSGTAYGSYGRNQAYEGQLSVSGAIIPNAVRSRLSFDAKGSDGSYTNANTGEHSQRFYEKSLRLRTIFDNGGPLTIDTRISGIYGTGGSHYYTAKMEASALSPDGTYVHGVHVTDISANKNLDIPYGTDVAGRYTRKILSGSVKADYNFGPVTLTSITGASYTYETLGGKNFPYADFNDASTNYYGWAAIFGDKTQGSRSKTTQIQQEIRLTSNGHHFIDYQAGFEFTSVRHYYSLVNNLNGAIPADIQADPALLTGYNGFTAGTRSLIGGGVLAPDVTNIYGVNTPYATTNYEDDRFVAHNYAPYANVRVNFTDALSLQLAGRYDIEQRNTGSVGPDLPNPFLGGASFNPCVRITGESAAECSSGIDKTFRQFQPKATLAYKLQNIGSVYASWGRSFKSGGFNPIGTREQSVQGAAAAYEALGESAAAARAHAENSVTAQDFYKKEVSTTYEAGFKADLFDRRLYLNGAVFWTDIKNGQLYVFDPIANVQSIQSINKERIKGFEIDGNFKLTNSLALFASYGLIDAKIREFDANPAVAGNRPPYVAHDTLSVGAQLNQPVSDGKTLTARVEYNRTGTTYYSIDNNPDFRRTPFGVLNARVGLSTARWDAGLFGRNILNKRYVNEIAPIIAGAATAISLAELATWGAEFRVRF